MQNGSENNRPGGNSGICPSKGSQRKEGNARKPGSDNSSDFTQSFVDYLTEKFSPKGLQSVLVLNAFRDPIAEMIQFFKISFSIPDIITNGKTAKYKYPMSFNTLWQYSVSTEATRTNAINNHPLWFLPGLCDNTGIPKVQKHGQIECQDK